MAIAAFTDDVIIRWNGFLKSRLGLSLVHMKKILQQQWHILVLWVIVVLSIVVRVFARPGMEVTPDSAWYLKLAEQVLNGKLSLNESSSLANIVQPGYSMFIALVHGWGVPVVSAAFAVNVAASIIMIIMGYALVRMVARPPAALVAAAALAFHPLLVVHARSVLTETVFIAVSMMIIWGALYLAQRQSSWQWYILLGGLIGFSYLIRMVGLVWLPWTGVVILITWYRARPHVPMQLIVRIAAVVIGLVIVALPYLGYLRTMTGATVLTGSQRTVQLSTSVFNVDADDLDTEKKRVYLSLTPDKTDYLINHPALFTQVMEARVVSLSPVALLERTWPIIGRNATTIAQYFSVLWIGVIVLLWLLVVKRKLIPPLVYYLVLAMVLYCGALSTVGIIARYILPILPFALVAVCVVLWRASFRLSFPQRICLYGFGIMLMVVLHAMFYLLWFESIVVYPQKAVTNETGQLFTSATMEVWTAAHVGKVPKILSTTPVVSYALGSTFYPMPYGSIDDIMQFAAYHNITYFFIQSTTAYSHAQRQAFQQYAMTHVQLKHIINDPMYSLYSWEGER